MPVEKIALGNTAANGTPDTVTAGSTVRYMLASYGPRARADVQLQDAAGNWVTVDVMTTQKPTSTQEGPGVFRVKRYGGSDAMFAVDKVDATPGAAPSNSVLPAITGSVGTGLELTCSTGTWTPDRGLTFSYQWQRAGVDITGATSSTYTVQEADEGNAITCDVTTSNGVGSTTASAASVTPPVEPVNTVAPAVTGTATTGNTLTSSQGTWTTSGTTTYAYQWTRAGVDIVGADENTYVLTLDDVGEAIRCRVTATNPGGSTSALSNTVTPAS